MKNILCFGDSNTYGLKPEWIKGDFGRHDENTRWPGAMRNILGDGYRVIEEGLCGRTTVFDDPTSPYRNGFDYLQPCLESHSPLDLVIIMLAGGKHTYTNMGSNDTHRTMHELKKEVFDWIL